MATAKSGKVIISCAITGSIHTPTMSDALPITPDEIAAQAIEAAEAGAAILHLHARDPKDGRPTPDPAVYMQFLPRIKQATDAIVNITTGGSVHMTLEERLAVPLLAKPEMCSLNMGTMNFGIFPLADRYTSWKHDWEHPYLRASDDFIFRNTFRDIERTLKTLGEEHGTCKRRSNNPSLKRPDFLVAPEQKSGSRYPFAVGLQRVGDEGRGALWARSLRGSDRGVEPSRGGATVWNRPSHGRQDDEVHGAAGLRAHKAAGQAEA